MVTVNLSNGSEIHTAEHRQWEKENSYYNTHVDSHEKATKHLAKEFDELRDLEKDSIKLCVFNNLAFNSRRTTVQKIFETLLFGDYLAAS